MPVACRRPRLTVRLDTGRPHLTFFRTTTRSQDYLYCWIRVVLI